MICYQDRTFCSGDGCAKFSECPRALTPLIDEKAKTAGLWIAQFAEPKKLDCYATNTTDQSHEPLPPDQARA